MKESRRTALEEELVEELLCRLAEARRKHPDFAEGPWQALGFLEEEAGEVAKEVTKALPDWEGRMCSELLDLMAVAARMWLGEWRR